MHSDQNPPRRRTTRLAFSALSLFLAFVPGCGSEPPPASLGGWSLLRRNPDELLWQPGALVPDPERQWGALGVVGWDATTHQREGMPFVWSRAIRSRLTLPAGPRRARTLALTLWCPPAERDAQILVVRLNGIAVQRTAICSEIETRRVHTPAELWQEGDNTLELELEELRVPPAGDHVRILSGGPDDAPAGLALARVEYDDARVPVAEPENARLELVDGTAAVYDVQLLAGSDLDVEAEPTGPGVLSLEFARLDPDTGAVRAELRRFDLDLQQRRIDRRFPIEAPPGDLVRVRVAWRSEAQAVLRFQGLDVLDQTRVDRFPVIMIAIDTLTAVHLSSYGYPRETSPRLDELARDSVVFEHCVSNSTWTLPSFMSLMTGQFAAAHKIRKNLVSGGVAELWEQWSLAENRWTLAEALRASGRRTAGWADTWWLGERFQFTQGFDSYDLSASEIPIEDSSGGIRHVSRLALEWIDRADARAGAGARDPFFLFLHCFDVHGPYAVDAPFAGRFEGDALWETERMRYAGGAFSTFGAVHEYITAADYPPGETPPEVAVGPLHARYDQGIALTDDALGAFLDSLKARGIYDEALIVVLADHGETMGAAEAPFSHGVLDEIGIHVPLIVKLPGNAQRGRRVPQTVQLVDVYPTLLDLIGAHPERKLLNGRSLVPLLEGESLPDVPTLCEDGVMAQWAVHLGDWKLVVKAPAYDSNERTLLTHPRLPKDWVRARFPELLEGALTEELLARYRKRDDYDETLAHLRQTLLTYFEVGLFRPREDPGEQVDLRAGHPEQLRALAASLFALMRAGEAARAAAKLPATTVQPSAADLTVLRGMGYAGE
jgi:arylsulfatase